MSVVAGAEGIRNIRSPAAFAMFCDLVESGESSLERGFGPSAKYKPDEGHQGRPHLDSVDRALFFGLIDGEIPEPVSEASFTGGSSQKLKPKDKRALKAKKEGEENRLKWRRNDANKKLDELIKDSGVTKEVGEHIRTSQSLRQFGGEIPMVGSGSEEQGQVVDSKTLNLVGFKEASLVARWLDMHVSEMKDEERKSFIDQLDKDQKDEALKQFVLDRLKIRIERLSG